MAGEFKARIGVVTPFLQSTVATGTAPFTVASTTPVTNLNIGGNAAGLSAALVATSGGTGQSSFAVGDILYASTTTALSKLTAGTSGYVLKSNGAGTAPSWAAVTATATNALTIGTGLSGTSYNGSTAVTIANTGVLSFSAGSTGLTPSTATAGTITLGGILNVANGGTGLSSTPANGALDIGNGTGFTRTTLTAGLGITVTNASGSITIASSVTPVTSVTGTAPVVSSGGTTPAISMAAATTSVNGYLTSTDWNTFNGKQAALVSGTNIKTVGGVSLLGSGDVGLIGGIYGGTGVNNGASTITVAGNLSHAGAFTRTFTATANTALTLPTSGTLISTVTNMAANPVTGTPSSTTYLRGDGTWTTPAGVGTATVTSVAQSFTGGLISVAGSPITNSGTLALTVAGTSGGIPYFSSGTTWASSAALTASALMVGGGAGAAPSTITTGTGVATALGVNVGSAGAFVTFNGALGTPSSGTVTNLTGTASININGTVGATTANTGAFTTLSASSIVSGTGFSTYLASPPAIGGTTAAAGSFTTLSASSTVSGTGFSTYLASPPAIGGTAAAAGNFTNSQITSLGVGTAASGTAGEIRATNNVTAFYSSDRQFKENIEDIPNALEIIDAIGGKLFDWTDAYLNAHGGEDDYFLHKHDFGVIAQDVQAVFPRAVRIRPDGSLAVDYDKLIALAFAAIKELKRELNK